MSGYQTILRLRRLEEDVAKLGFMFAYPKHRYGDEQDVVALRPLDSDTVPIYSRDAEIFCGTLEQLEVWLRGVKWARDYDMLLKVSDEKRRVRKEQDVRNRHMMQLLKSEKVVQKD
jgi:hypothetical protein